MRRALASADFFSERAIARALLSLKTPDLRSMASLCSVTRLDHLREFGFFRGRLAALPRPLTLDFFFAVMVRGYGDPSRCAAGRGRTSDVRPVGLRHRPAKPYDAMPHATGTPAPYQRSLAALAPNRAAVLACARSASISRSRGSAVVSSASRSARAEAATSSTARSKAARLALEGLLNPLTFLTNCKDAARISCSVAGGEKLKRVLMLLHTAMVSCSGKHALCSAPRGATQRPNQATPSPC